MIRLTGVEKAYRSGDTHRTVLDGVDLTVERGDYVAILGQSGSGKTTLLNIIGGLDTGYRGEVEVSGRRLGELDDDALSELRRRTVAFVFQSFNLVAPLTVLENVLLPAWFDPGAGSDAEDRAWAALEQVGLGSFAHRRPDALSGGERQRVAIARAVAARPEVLLCDEPTGNLDRRTGAEVIDLFGALHDAGHTLLMVTHEARVSERARRVLRLEAGRLVPGEAGEGAR